MGVSASRKTIEIYSKEDFLKLWNTTEYYEGYGSSKYQPGSGYDRGDAWHHGVKNADIVLKADIEVSSDDINAPIIKNEHDPVYNFGFGMNSCSFDGEGHTVTVTKGKRDIYPLFGDIKNDAYTETPREIKNLTIVYKGDVIGSAFARNIYSLNSYNPTVDYKISNIEVAVEGSILPYATLMPGNQYDKRNDIDKAAYDDEARIDTENFAVGMACAVDSVQIDGYKLHVRGNIGSSEVKKNEFAKTELVHAKTAGLFYGKSKQSFKVFPEIRNVSIDVGGGRHGFSPFGKFDNNYRRFRQSSQRNGHGYGQYGRRDRGVG